MKDRFKQILDNKGLNAQKTASLIGIDASAVSHLLNGKRKPSFEVLDKIGQAFPDINLNWLISGKGTMCNNISAQAAIPPVANTESTLLFEDNFPKEKNIIPSEPIAVSNSNTNIQDEVARTILPAITKKKISRIILFFEDGSFEDYSK